MYKLSLQLQAGFKHFKDTEPKPKSSYQVSKKPGNT